MMLKMIALCLIIASATAFPSTAKATPEDTFLENSYAEAKSMVSSLLQSGKDQGACADLADATIKEVEDSVNSAQQTLDSLDNGDECHKEGQDAVDAAQTALDNANQAKSDADQAVAHADSQKVQFDPVPLSELKEGHCATFFDDAAYIAAKKALTDAKEAAVKADGAVDAAQKAMDAAKESAKEAVNACYCRVKKAYDSAWEAATENSDANAKAYTKGKHMHCVLAGTPPADCHVGEVPAVKPRTLNEGVNSATCDSNDNNYETKEPQIFQEGDTSPVPDQGVTFYKHCVSDGRYAQGYRVTIFHDTPNVGEVGMRNNDVSGIWIPHGWKVEIFDHTNYGGTVKSWDACNKENEHVGCLVHHGFNDRMESVKMSPC